MPELPEVEVLVRHLAPLIRDRRIIDAEVRRPKILAPTSVKKFNESLIDATFVDLTRRGKYLLFEMRRSKPPSTFVLVGHLGMTGRMYLSESDHPLPKHAAVVLQLDRDKFIFEDTRCFGRLTLDTGGLEKLGPEPLSDDFTLETFSKRLKQSAQSVKVKLLDQRLVAGVGNIYASEALFRAGISPRTAARRLRPAQVGRLWQSIRDTLADAIAAGSTVPLNYSGTGTRDGLFYFGRASGTKNSYEERLRVYDRQGEPCWTCRTRIKRIVQAARSTFYCSQCQRSS